MGKEFNAVLDTNVLVHGLVEGAADCNRIIQLVEKRALRIYRTPAIKLEYDEVFSRATTSNMTPITAGHRITKDSILKVALTVNSNNLTGRLATLPDSFFANMHGDDLKFIHAADAVAALTQGLVYIISNDAHITSFSSVLSTVGIIAQDASYFLSKSGLGH